MNLTKLGTLILAIAAALYMLFPHLSWAEDRTSSYGSEARRPSEVSIIGTIAHETGSVVPTFSDFRGNRAGVLW
jgi:hypothetical protein